MIKKDRGWVEIEVTHDKTIEVEWMRVWMGGGGGGSGNHYSLKI